MFSIVKKVFGTAQGRTLKKYSKIVEKINKYEKTLQSLSDDELKELKNTLQKRLQEGETPNDILVEAYALVKNVCRRLVGKEVHVSGYDQKWDMIPFDVQLLGGIAMHHGSIAEMGTGEGKTLTAALPLFLHALTGKPTHLVTVNDYLAKRDCQWIGEIFRWFGLTVKALTGATPVDERKKVYEADIVYGTASEFGFDYLRDNSMAMSKEEQVQRGFYFAIVDEIDSILIDEARTPLIISGPSTASRQMYEELKAPVESLVRKQVTLCNSYAQEARRSLEKLGLMKELEEAPSLTKADEEIAQEAFRKLWIVSQGMPRHKDILMIRENPDLRARLENLETYYHGEANKDDRLEALSELHIIIDERANDYEMTDKGIEAWGSLPNASGDDFTFIDLGGAYADIDQDSSLSDQEKLHKKTEVREADLHKKERTHNIRQLLRAHLLMEIDVDYIVQDQKIVIIDENTGRPQPGRRFSDGLHQAIEAKERVRIQQETQTYATITLQNYFRLYTLLAGMTGTAMTEAQEFKEIYKLDVLAIPPNKPCMRDDQSDIVYMTEREKYQAILNLVVEVHATGQPVLLGTESVEASEKLSRVLNSAKLKHTVLNAKNHAKEAEIIAEAGVKGAITVATNMAGRGTDIKLGEGVKELGGLCVIATTRHESRRIDNQLRGRSGRQGDPGRSKFFISFEDTLMRLFTSKRITAILQRFRPPEGEAIEAGIIDRSIGTAQKRLEQRNYSIRKHTLEYDDVMNKHRSEVYIFRNQILHRENPLSIAREIVEDFSAELVFRAYHDRSSDRKNPQELSKELMTHFPITMDAPMLDEDNKSIESLEQAVIHKVHEGLKQKLEHEARTIAALQQLSGKEIDPKVIIYDIVRNLLIKTIDKHWQEHLLLIDNLRTEVNLSTVAQKDPLLEFKQQAFDHFERFTRRVKEEMSHVMFSFEMSLPESKEVQDSVAKLQKMSTFKPFITFEEEKELALT